MRQSSLQLMPGTFFLQNVFCIVTLDVDSFGGLGVACWPLVPKFAGSNPAEAVGFLGAKKSSARLPSVGKYSRRSHVVDLRHVKDP